VSDTHSRLNLIRVTADNDVNCAEFPCRLSVLQFVQLTVYSSLARFLFFHRRVCLYNLQLRINCLYWFLIPFLIQTFSVNLWLKCVCVLLC